jgi:hypothetical protein
VQLKSSRVCILRVWPHESFDAVEPGSYILG